MQSGTKLARPRFIRSVVAVLALMISSQAATDDTEPGVVSFLTGSGGDLYTLSLPAGEAPTAPAPLVVSLHYGGPVSPHYGSGLLQSVVEPALRGLGAVMLAPDCGARRWLDCESLVLSLMDEVATNYAIDARRVVLTGYSKGGIGTWDLVARHPDRFGAAVVMAGRPDEGLAKAGWLTPTRVVHASNDEVFPVAATQSVVSDMRAAGAPVDLEILQGVSHYQTDRFIEPLSRAVPWLREVWSR